MWFRLVTISDRKYWPFWISVLILDLNQNSGLGRSLWSRISRNGILLTKLFWPTVRNTCSSDREQFLRSLEQFIQTVKGQQFLVTECFLAGFSYLINWNNWNSNWKKLLGFWNMQENLENISYLSCVGLWVTGQMREETIFGQMCFLFELFINSQIGKVLDIGGHFSQSLL